MALPELLRALREQADERRAEELAQGRSTADRIRGEAETARERRRDEVLFRATREEEDAAHRRLSLVRAEAAESVLVARSRLLDRVREALSARIECAGEDPGYLRLLPGELLTALDRISTRPVVVRAPPELVSHLRRLVGSADQVRVEPAETMPTGFTVHSPDDRIEIDGTLVTRLEHAWPRLAVAVVAGVGL